MARRRPDPVRRAGVPAALERLLAGPRGLALLAFGFAGLALAVYAPSLSGPFVSDDLHYVATNPYVHELSLANVLDVLDPGGAASVFVVNYTPVHLLLHGLEWQLFGPDPTGFHVVNVLLHALGSVLLAAVFARAGLPAPVAAFGGLVFLVHPANVEGVAWISQLKTPASFVLALAALLAHPRRPALGAALFGLALLAKPTAAAALPVAALLDWTRERRLRLGWLSLWAALLGGYAIAEFATHERSGSAEPIDADPLVRLRTSLAIVARYLWMSLTSLGVGPFHEPAPVRDLRDPWFLAGLAATLALGARALTVLWRRSPEAAFWVWAAVSFLPVSQLFPFLHPMADRYLYWILPGLLGAALFAGCELWERAFAGRDRARARAGRIAMVSGVLVALAFSAHAYRQAGLWASPTRLLADAARRWPEGRVARLVEARRAAQAGDAEAAIAALRSAWQGGFNRFEQLQSDPALAPLRGDPRFQALVREIAGWWVDRLSALPDPTQLELRTLALAHLARGEQGAAIAALERALERGGPIDARIREEISQLRGAGG